MKHYRHQLLLTIITVFISASAFSQGYQEISLVEHDENGAQFGQSIEVEDSLAVVRCQLCPNGGAAFVYQYDGSIWNRIAKLTASNAPNGSSFARSVDISGDVIVVSDRISRVYIYEKPATGWQDATESAILTSPSRAGEFVRISEDYVIMASDAGFDVFLFEKPVSGWTSASPTSVISGSTSNFGRGLDILGDTILIAEGNSQPPGYLYIKPLTGWPSTVTIPDVVLDATIAANKTALTREAIITTTNIYVSLSGRAAHIYDRPSGGWGSESVQTEDYLLSPQNGFSFEFGFSMDVVSDSIVAVSDRGFNGFLGTVEIFYADCDGWVSKGSDETLSRTNPMVNDRFGQSLAFGPDLGLLVGSDQIDRNGLTNSGGFYYFQNEQLLNPVDAKGTISVTSSGQLFSISEFGEEQLINDLSTALGRNIIMDVRGTLLTGSDQLLYGVSYAGPNSSGDQGFIFRVYPDGRNFEIIHEFDGVANGQTGTRPTSSLIEVNGLLYGTTEGDFTETTSLSRGSIYSIARDGTGFATIYTPSTASGMYGIYHTGGFLYASESGSSSNIFKVSLNGSSRTVLESNNIFLGNLAEYNGKLYGAALLGGTNNNGFVFSIDLSNNDFTNLQEFVPATGTRPQNGVSVSNGILIGVTEGGGSFNDGTIYTYDIEAAVFSKVYDFNMQNRTKSEVSTSDLSGLSYVYGTSGGTNRTGILVEVDAVCGIAVQEIREFGNSIINPISAPVFIDNTPPLVLSQIPGQLLEEDQMGFTLDLSGFFDASDEPVSNLDLRITSNSNPALFSSIAISNADDITTASLDIDLAANLFGTSDLQIIVRDARGGEATASFLITVDPTPDTPIITNATTTYGIVSEADLVITPNADDGSEVTHYQITNIVNGSVLLNDQTAISAGEFITIAQGSAGLKWSPTEAMAGFFDVQASTVSNTTGLGGDKVTATITVSPAALTITANDQTKSYGATNPGLTLTYAGFVNSEDETVLDVLPTVATIASQSSEVGTYAITASGADDPNYTFTYTDGTLTVDKAALSVTAISKTIIYGESLPTFDGVFIGVVNNDDIT
ncbi:MAG: MBG domain-containing protein, partial [Bacteroidota bacterium]